MTHTTDELNQTGIYAIINLDNGKAYIGSAAVSFRSRWDKHKHYLRKNNHHSTILQRAWNKYTEFRFEFKIIEVVPKEEWTDKRYLLDIEQMYLDTYQSEYNISKSAGNLLGFKHSESSKKKMREACKNRIVSEETRRKLSKAVLGRTHSEETKKKLREISLNSAARFSKESKLKSIKALSKDWVVTPPSGEEIFITNLNEFCRLHNLNSYYMSQVARGIRDKHKGYRCRYNNSTKEAT